MQGSSRRLSDPPSKDGDRAVILDFEQLVYISSAGLRAVLMTAKGMYRRDVGFGLCCLTDVCPGRVRHKRISDKIITIHSTRAEAIAAFAR